MQSLADVTITEFQQALTSEKLRVSQIIHVALAAGAMTLALVAVGLFLMGDRREPLAGAFSMANILSGVNVLMAMTMPMVGWIISSKQLSAARLQGAVTQEFRNEKGQLISTSPADKCIMLIRTSSILQLATLEGSAFLGLAVCLIVTTEGVAQAEPAYLFNMATCLPLFGFIVATFPTRASFTNIFETKIQNNR